MNKYLKNIIFAIIVIFVLDFTFGIIYYPIIFDINTGVIGKVNKCLNSEVDILILGSSRAQHHYEPKIIGDITGSVVFNAGLGGQGIYYNYALLKEKIKRGKPKKVLLDISPNVIVDDKSFEKILVFLPYYKNLEAFREVISLSPSFIEITSYSNFLLNNSTIYDVFKSIVLNKKSYTDGFVPLQSTLDTNQFDPFFYSGERFTELKKEYYRKIISLCEQNDIELFCVISPSYLKFDKNNVIIDELKKILADHDLKLYDFSDREEFYGKAELFKDQLHLNLIGARKYSTMIAELIK